MTDILSIRDEVSRDLKALFGVFHKSQRRSFDVNFNVFFQMSHLHLLMSWNNVPLFPKIFNRIQFDGEGFEIDFIGVSFTGAS